MAISFGNITLDCGDAEEVGTFWAAALERPLDNGATEGFSSIGIGGPAPRWLFIQVPEPKQAKNRIHVDFEADDPAAEVARLTSLGATKVGDMEEWGHRWSVLHDVEGNEFCVS